MLQAKPPRLAFRTASTKTSTDEPASDIILPEETLQTRTLPSRTGLSALLLVAIAVAPAFAGTPPKGYKGTPYKDDHHPNRVQSIPGRVECALYDRGGEGVAYHDTEPKNLGSGTLNPADGTYLNQFRMDEGVDSSYTKFHNAPDRIDDNPYDVVQPPDKQLYVGWTEPGEWFNITVQVARAGVYSADLLYTSNRGGAISVDLNGKPASGPLNIPSTFNAADPVAWRQWHHWNLAPAIMKLRLPSGKSVLTIHILKGGNMNFAYFDFKPVR
jgi:hypothetical protein